jgi:uncharacterized repeat protein (TIGR03847 family)
MTLAGPVPIIAPMDTPEYDFGRALSIDADAVGQPGQRRFRLLVRSSNQTASVWMEKEQLAGIGTWLDEVLERLQKDNPTGEPDVEPLPFPEPMDMEMRASQVGLGYVEQDDVFVIQAFDAERAGSSQTPTFRCMLIRGQARVLTRKIEDVIAGGRPICPLCERPIDPSGHVCPRANGHHRVGAMPS